MSDFVKGVLPRNAFTWAGLILGSMSILRLFEVAFDFQFVPTIALILSWYDEVLKAIVEIELPFWVGPLIDKIVGWLREWTRLDITLHSHWKHIFVLTGVYVFRNIALALNRGHYGTTIFNAVWGLTIALYSGIGSGAIAVSRKDAWANFLIAAIPVSGIFLYETGRGIWGATFHRGTRVEIQGAPKESWLLYFRGWMKKIALRDSFILIVVATAIYGGLFNTLSSPGLATYGLATFALSLYLIGQGIKDIGELQRKPGEGPVEAFSRTYQGNHGLAMLWIFLQAVLVVGINFSIKLSMGL